jgi:hypothetical protein
MERHNQQIFLKRFAHNLFPFECHCVIKQINPQIDLGAQEIIGRNALILALPLHLPEILHIQVIHIELCLLTLDDSNCVGTDDRKETPVLREFVQGDAHQPFEKFD